MSDYCKTPKLRVGTRGSPLALAQTAAVLQSLFETCGLASSEIEVKVIKTVGDQIQNRALSEVGGKGLFTKEIDVALASGEIDFAVHSAKDVPTLLFEGLMISAYLERGDVRDAFISRGPTLETLPRGASVGTVSLRREAQVKRLRSDLEVRPVRGNVHTRLRRVDDREIDATILGMAGLTRLGLAPVVTEVLSTDDFLPAVGQGAIAIETRKNDHKTRDILAAVNHVPTAVAVTAERAFLAVLDGSCRTPIAGHALVSGDRVAFRGMVLQSNGLRTYETARSGTIADAARIGADAGAELKSKASGAGRMAQAV
jgi:hydroxymethylbilane synthase